MNHTFVMILAVLGGALLLCGTSFLLFSVIDWITGTNRTLKQIRHEKVVDCFPSLIDQIRGVDSEVHKLRVDAVKSMEKLQADETKQRDRCHGRVTSLIARVAFLEDQLYPSPKPTKDGKPTKKSKEREHIDASRMAETCDSMERLAQEMWKSLQRG